MPILEPPALKSEIEEQGSTLRLVIPSPKNWFVVAFMSFWLLGWLAGELFVGGMIAGGLIALLGGLIHLLAPNLVESPVGGAEFALAFPSMFLCVWFIGWTVGGAFAIYSWLWQVTGKEVVDINRQSLTVRKTVLGFSRPKEYGAQYMRNLRVTPTVNIPWGWGMRTDFWGGGAGKLAFDYGAKTVNFGSGIDEAEAAQLLARIQKRFPDLLAPYNKG